MQGATAIVPSRTGTIPAKKAGSDLWSYPGAVLDLHLTCNQNCPYCVAGAVRGNDFGRIVDPRSVGRLKAFMHDYGPFNLILTGGEPLITPGFRELLEYLAAEGHLISLQSNLKADIGPIFEALPAERTGWILATLHSVALPKSDVFIRKVSRLRTAGYPVVVKLVLDRPMLEVLEDLDERMKQEKIPVLLSPLIRFDQGREPFAQTYDPGQWAVIAPRITLRSSWLYFAGGFRSRGFLCRAGSQAFYIRVNTGEVGGCAHNFPDHLGDVYANTLRPADKAVACGLDLCLCDYNYYAGLILDLDDRQGFRKLLDGDLTPVSHDEYLKWIDKAGLKAVNDLAPVLDLALNLGKSDHYPKEPEVKSRPAHPQPSSPAAGRSNRLTVVPAENLPRVLDFEAVINLPEDFGTKSLKHRTLEDDGPVLAYLFRNFKPGRHLEFGAKDGRGAELCLRQGGASVWTVVDPAGGNGQSPLTGPNAPHTDRLGRNTLRADTIPDYVHSGLGGRVYQVRADSRKWETGNLPAGFFDSVLINNEPIEDRVKSDTFKALEMVRSGGLVIWRYFCPPVMSEIDPVRVTMTVLLKNWADLTEHVASLFWVEPSWLLVGIKK